MNKTLIPSKLFTLLGQATPTPWDVCGASERKCKCGQIWSKPADHPVAQVEIGKWGDTYASIRFCDDDAPGTISAKVEAYTDMIEYGEIPEETAFANAELIVQAVNFVAQLAKRNQQSVCDELARLYEIEEKYNRILTFVGLPVPEGKQTPARPNKKKSDL